MDTKTCPRCRATAWRLHLSSDKVSKDVKILADLSKLAKDNPLAAGVAMGASGSLLIADRLGLIKIYLCKNCHHPFVP